MNFNEPVYCDFYKNLTVEDLTFIENIAEAHYGKCSIIGYIKKYDDDIYLESITLPHVNKNYKFPNGFTKILLILNTYKGDLKLNQPFEVFGEVMAKNMSSDDSLLATPKDLIIRLSSNIQRDLQYNLGLPISEPTGTIDKHLDPHVLKSLNKEIDIINNIYVPAVRVHYLIPLEEPTRLLECNLKIKAMRLQYSEKLKLINRNILKKA